MKKIVIKYFKRIQDEFPSFKECILSCLQLVNKKISGKDTSMEKRRLSSSIVQVKVTLTTILLLLIAIVVVSSRKSSPVKERECHPQVELLQRHQHYIEEHEKKMAEHEKERAEQKKALELARHEKNLKYQAAKVAREKELELRNAYQVKCEELRREENLRREELGKWQSVRVSEIRAEKRWPRLCVNGITLGEPLPDEFADFKHESELPLNKPYLGFTSMRVSVNRKNYAKQGIVSSISLMRRWPYETMSLNDAKMKLDNIANEINQVLGCKSVINTPEYPVGIAKEMYEREWWKFRVLQKYQWEGIPKWEASLEGAGDVYKLGVKFTIHSYEIVKLVCEMVESEYELKAEELNTRIQSERNAIDAWYAKELERLRNTASHQNSGTQVNR